MENLSLTADLLRSNLMMFTVLSTICGLMVGSFVNVVIHRLPKMMEREWKLGCAEMRGETLAAEPKYSLIVPRSTCPQCGHKITALENIPVLSYLFLHGKCSDCKAAISIRYPFVELLAGALAGFSAWHFGFGITTVAAWLFIFALLALTFIDFDTQLLPDDITLPLMWVGLFFNLSNGFTDLHSALVGAMAGYLSLWSVYWAFKLVTGKEGMGYGDFKLLAAIGAWFGWQMLPAVILLSSIAGSIIGIGLIVLARHGRNVPIPFGPYLAMGGIVTLFWGHQLTQLYLPGY